MNKIAHALVAASLTLPTHSALALTSKSPANCTKERGCEVTVSVGGNSCGGGISVSPDPLIVDLANGGPLTITWKVTGGWEFDTNGIVLAIPGKEIFPKPYNAGNKTTFEAVNDVKTRGTFKYDINLVKNGVQCGLDPTIVNH